MTRPQHIAAALLILTFEAAALVYGFHADAPKPLDPRAYHCDPQGALACDEVRP